LEEALGENLVEGKKLRGDLGVEKTSGGVFALVKMLEGLTVVAQRLGERGMKNQMGPLDLHVESVICTELHCFTL